MVVVVAADCVGLDVDFDFDVDVDAAIAFGLSLCIVRLYVASGGE